MLGKRSCWASLRVLDQLLGTYWKCWAHLSSLHWSFLSINFCRAGFVDMFCVNLVLSWNILLSPSKVIEIFVGYTSLGWNLWSLSNRRTSIQDLRAFRFSMEKSAEILLGLSLYVTWPFSLLLLIFYVYPVCLLLIIMCQGNFVLWGSSLFGVQ